MRGPRLDVHPQRSLTCEDASPCALEFEEPKFRKVALRARGLSGKDKRRQVREVNRSEYPVACVSLEAAIPELAHQAAGGAWRSRESLARARCQPALPWPASAPSQRLLAPGMEVEPTPELCAALRGVRVGDVRTLTTYCLRGGSATRKMACVKFRTEEQREACFLARADADRLEEDKFEEFKFAVNVLGLLPFGWGNQTDRTFPTEKEAVAFRVAVGETVERSNPREFYALMGAPPSQRKPCQAVTASSAAPAEVASVRTPGGTVVNPPVCKKLRYVPKRASTVQKTESFELHFWTQERRQKQTLSFTTKETAGETFAAVQDAALTENPDEEIQRLLLSKRRRKEKRYEGTGQDVYKAEILAFAGCPSNTVRVQLGGARAHSQVRLDNQEDAEALLQNLLAAATNQERKQLVDDARAAVAKVEKDPFTEKLPDCPLCLEQYAADPRLRVAKVMRNGLCGHHNRTRAAKRPPGRAAVRKAAVPASGPMTTQEFQDKLRAVRVLFLLNATDSKRPQQGETQTGSILARWKRLEGPHFLDVAIYGDLPHEKNSCVRTSRGKRRRIGVENWLEQNEAALMEAVERGTLIYLVGSHAARTARAFVPKIVPEERVIPHANTWAWKQNKSVVANALGLTEEELDARLAGTWNTVARLEHMSKRDGSGRFVGDLELAALSSASTASKPDRPVEVLEGEGSDGAEPADSDSSINDEEETDTEEQPP